MDRYVIFGAGKIAKSFINYIGACNIEFIVDNNEKLHGKLLEKKLIYHFDKCKHDLEKFQVIIAVSPKYVGEINEQLDSHGLYNHVTYKEILYNETQSKLQGKKNISEIYKKAIGWIYNNTLKQECGMSIIVSSSEQIGYPEVTGYYIPTLISWKQYDLAIEYAKWLLSIQKENGCWFDAYDKEPFVFDTAQILKGLLAVRKITNLPGLDNAIIKACNWLIAHIDKSGRFNPDDARIWSYHNNYSELIHLYCLSPIKEAGYIFSENDYINKVNLSVNYYKNYLYEDIMKFSLLSHFYAYVMEALVDLNELDLARMAMSKLECYQDEMEFVPAYHDVHWVCSTGLFQLAIVWYRLGDEKLGNQAFEYVCKLQNSSGGWYGGYTVSNEYDEENTYFQLSEISWAVKYFLDALYWKNKNNVVKE